MHIFLTLKILWEKRTHTCTASQFVATEFKKTSEKEWASIFTVEKVVLSADKMSLEVAGGVEWRRIGLDVI